MPRKLAVAAASALLHDDVSFNEAAATMPRKSVSDLSRLVSDRADGFNEAAATMPRKSVQLRVVTRCCSRFNEAAATMPRK